ncbi:MAG: hypothetical protein ACOCX2_15435, partial [Armatimonadota bacterium]
MRVASTVTAVALIAVLSAATACAQGNLPEPVQAAVADLADELNIGQDEISVASFEEVTWPDASLGNAEPGRVYAQVQTPGYRVFLHADGERYEYHTDSGTRVTSVGSGPIDEAPQPAQDDREQLRQRLSMIAAAKRHVANRLDIDAEDVYLAAVEERTWPSTALGVEEPDEAHAQVMTPGLRLVLEARGILYDYHADMAGQVKPAGIVEPGQSADGGDEGQARRTPAVEMAITDLAGRLSMDPEGIAVEDVEEVQWPNSALGLPEPGMMYTMAVMPGHRIVLRAKQRMYEYHAASRGEQATVRYAGIVYPEDAEVSVLAMSRTEPTDGNNFFHLQRIDPQSQERETVVEFVSGFVATPDGRDLLIKRRTSRSSHELVQIAPDGAESTLASAFDITGMALRADGQMLAYWARPSVTNRDPRLIVRARPWADEQMPIQPTLPGVRQGDFSAGALVWTDEGLALTVRTDTGARSFFWTSDGDVEELGRFVVLGRIPRTRALLIRRAENNREVLAAFIPGEGETAVLADVPDLQSADAPVGEEWVVAATGDGGAPE